MFNLLSFLDFFDFRIECQVLFDLVHDIHYGPQSYRLML